MSAVKQSPQDYLFDDWVAAEAAYEHFSGDYEQIDVLIMPAREFAYWEAEYTRLYNAVLEAQLAYYRAVRNG